MNGKEPCVNGRTQRKSDIIKSDIRRNWSLYLMIVPGILFYLIFMYGPLYGALIAFKDYSPGLGFLESPWVGLKHFKDFFASSECFRLIYNTLKINLAALCFGFPAPIVLAILINEMGNGKFKRFTQTVSYMPHFISLVVICSLIREFTLDTGVINYILGFFGFSPTSLLNFPQYFTTVYVASGIWQEIGWGSIIYLAALSGLDPALYEAATIDGANRFDQMLHVTLPGILPTIIIMLILKLGQVLSVGYEKIILLYNDNTMSVADVISTYVYAKGLLDLDWSFSSAVGLFNSIINFLFLNAANFISKKTGEYSLW